MLLAIAYRRALSHEQFAGLKAKSMEKFSLTQNHRWNALQNRKIQWNVSRRSNWHPEVFGFARNSTSQVHKRTGHQPMEFGKTTR